MVDMGDDGDVANVLDSMAGGGDTRSAFRVRGGHTPMFARRGGLARASKTLPAQGLALVDGPGRNGAGPAGDQGAHAIGQVGDLGQRPVLREAVDEGCGEGVARPHGVADLDRIPRRFDPLSIAEDGTALLAQGDGDDLPAAASGPPRGR